MKHAREDYNRIQDPENLIPEDEPVFILRGQDVFAPCLLRLWAQMLKDYGGDHKMADKVLKHADAMQKWQEDVKVKLPDE